MNQLVFILIIFIASSSFAASGAKNELANYEALIEKLLLSQKDKTKKADLVKQSKAMILSSKKIIKSFIKVFPKCEKYLSLVTENSEKILKMPLEKIEKDYHKDGALPKADASCYNAKDLIVHPITALVLAERSWNDDKARAQIKDEILEVKAHFGYVKSVLTKK